MAIEGSSFELGVVSDSTAIRRFLSELEVIPAALKRVSQAINSVDLGDGRKFEGDARKLAEAFIAGARAEFAGGNFQRVFRDAMSGVDLRIPAEAQAHLRADLERINAEIRRALPQQVQIGIRTNTTGAAFRETLQAGAPQAFSGGAQAQQETTRTFVEMREAARELRQSARQAELGTTRERSGGASAQELLKAADLVDRTSERYQAAALRLADATDKGARTLERVATREEIRGSAEQRFPGGPDVREEALARATEANRTQRALKQLGLEQPGGVRLDTQLDVGASEPVTPFRRFVAAQAQRDQVRGRLEEQAFNEDVKRTQNELRLVRLAQAEDTKREEAARKATALADPTSEGSVLRRASDVARDRRVQTQQFLDQNPQVSGLVEADRLRGLAKTAQREELRQGGPVDQAHAGILGFGNGTFIERQASILSTTASFALGGQIFQGVMNGITEVVSGTRQFEEALSNLSVTFNDSTNNLRGFATEVGAEANAVGLTQAQGVEAASRSVGLFNTSGDSEQGKEDFARIAVAVSGRIAQQSGGTKDLPEVETNLAGVLRSFQLENSDLTRVEDSIAVIAKKSGLDQADILKAASETGTLARAAGFDAFQTSAVIANQATTTGQTANTAAEQLKVVFAQATNANVQAKFNQLGINTNSTLADQLGQLSQKVQGGQVSQDEFATISGLFGRSRGASAFRNLINGLPHANDVADQARNSPGEGARQFEQIFGNINGEIIKTVGSLKNVATELAQSGLLDLLAGIVLAVGQTANALTQVLHLFNEIYRPLRTAALAIGELALAAKLLGGTEGGSRVLALLGGTTGIGQKVITRVAGAETASTVAARFGSAGSAASGLGLLTNPATIAAIAAISAVIIAQKIGDADQTALRSEGAASTSAANAVTAEQLRGAASARRQAASDEQARRDAALGLGNVVDFFNGSQATKTAARDKSLAAALDARAKVVEQQQTASTTGTNSLFGRFDSPDEVATQLERLQAEGLTAAQRVRALSDAFDEIASTANKAGVAVIQAGGGGLFGQGIAAGVTGAIGVGANQADLRAGAANALDQGNFISNRFAAIGAALTAPFTAGSTPVDADAEKKFRDLATKLQGTDTAKLQGNVNDAIQGVLASRHIDTSKGDAVLTQDDIDAIKGAANDQLEAFINSVIPAGPEFDEIRRIIRDSFKVNLAHQLAQLPKAGPLSPDQAVDFFNSTSQQADQAFNETSFRDKAGASATRVKTLDSALQRAKNAVNTFIGPPSPSTINRLADAQNAYDRAVADDQKVQLEKTQALIRLRESRRGSLDQTGRLQDELDAAQAGVAAATDPTDKANAQAALNNLLSQQQTLALDTATSVARSTIDPRNTSGQAQAAIADAQRRLDFARANGDAKAVADATTALTQANVQALQTQVSIANAKRSSQVPLGDQVAAANAALANAKAEQGATLKGTEAYYNALVQVQQARQAATQALLDRQQRQALLRIDITDPVAQARAAVQDAQRRLRAATGPDDRDKAREDLRQAQVNAESAAFQQRLSDVQTADQLGRISHQQYLSYLHSEHDRLTAIKTRTRQQQDELNQIDLLMKNAAQELSGQFNLGNIKLPTVYEVRRAIKAGAGGILSANNGFAGAANGQVVNDNSQRTLVIQGVSLEEVLRRVTALYGGKPVRTTAGRKV